MRKNTFLLLCLVSFNYAFAFGSKAPNNPSPSPTPSPSPAPTPTPVPKPTPTPSKGIGARWESAKGSTGVEWSEHTLDEFRRLASSLEDVLPSDANDFCPQLPKLSDQQTREFYVYLVSSIAQLESNFNTNLSYRESFKDSKGNYIYSRGLLQISIESGNGYGCGFRNEQELHDPFKNLSCGVRILNRWITRDGRIAGQVGGSWRGGARYWAVLRTSSKVSQIKSWTRSFCSKF